MKRRRLKAVYNMLQKEVNVGGLILAEKDAYGNITLIKADSAAMNMIALGATMEAQSLMGAVTASFNTRLDEAGINQTRYRTYIVLNVYMRMGIGLSTQTIEVKTEVFIADAIIVGKVPDTYADVNDATEFLNLMP